ncbi:MAG: hypothetical protein K2P58_07835, partial [Hyphomonadaceae bacterium]|nr:hypothetical protein [Hyphomonadaceae bacterium]
MKLSLDSLVMMAFFAVLPAAAIGGAMALPVMLSVAGLLVFRPSLAAAGFRKPPPILLILIIFLTWAAATTAWAPLPSNQAF